MIAIKDIEMPKRCAECKICVNQKTNDYGTYGKCLLQDKRVDCLAWSRDKNCPLTESEEQSTLDKIRAEILEEKDFAYADFERYKVEYLGVDAEYVEDELPQDDFRYGMERAIEIIDKYKVESED